VDRSHKARLQLQNHRWALHVQRLVAEIPKKDLQKVLLLALRSQSTKIA
jgi:hypothetical protein